MIRLQPVRAPRHDPPRITVVAPAGPVDPEALQKGLQALRKEGFEPRAAKGLDARWGHLAGRDEERAHSLQEALLDEDCDLVLAARGGFGCARLLPLLDYEALARRAPTLIGYSDLSALQMALLARCGLPSLHAPMLASEWSRGLDPPSRDSQLAFFQAGLAGGPLQELQLRPDQVLVPGRCEGWLAAANLSVLTSLAGTPWLPDLRGAVLFLEEYGEYPFRLDRHLAQLRNCGALEGLAGIVLGQVFGCEEPDPDKSTFSAEHLLEQYFGDLGLPVLRDFPFGHRPPRLSLPQGGRVVCDTEKSRLLILPPGSPILAS